jgi:hypothetical protein
MVWRVSNYSFPFPVSFRKPSYGVVILTWNHHCVNRVEKLFSLDFKCFKKEELAPGAIMRKI